MNIPAAEYGNTQSGHNVTPRLRQMLRANEGLSPSAPTAAPLVHRRAPVVTGGVITAAAVGQALANALVPVVAELELLKRRSTLASRTAVRRALAPVVSRQAVAVAVSGGPAVVIRTVRSHAHGGLPTRRQVFSPAQVARASTGLGLTERSSAPNRPIAFRSRYTSSTFATQSARDNFDSQFENKPNGVAIHGDLIRRNQGLFPTI